MEKPSAIAPTVAATQTESPDWASFPLPDKPLVLNESQSSLSSLSFAELWAYRELLYFLTWRDIKVRYKQTAMGAAWAIIQPLFMMVVFAVFFGLVGVPTDGMPQFVFFYCGLLPWTFVGNAITTGSISLVSNSNLITKVYFPRVIVPVATVGAGIVDLLIASVILILLSLCFGIHVTWGLLILPLLFVMTILLALAFGVWLSALTVKYRDVRHALPFALQFWFFATPIIYPLSIIPAKWRWVMYLNPLTGIIEGLRAALAGRDLNWTALAVSGALILALLVCALYAFRRIEKSFADLI